MPPKSLEERQVEMRRRIAGTPNKRTNPALILNESEPIAAPSTSPQFETRGNGQIVVSVWFVPYVRVGGVCDKAVSLVCDWADASFPRQIGRECIG